MKQKVELFCTFSWKLWVVIFSILTLMQAFIHTFIHSYPHSREQSLQFMIRQKLKLVIVFFLKHFPKVFSTVICWVLLILTGGFLCLLRIRFSSSARHERGPGGSEGGSSCWCAHAGLLRTVPFSCFLRLSSGPLFCCCWGCCCCIAALAIASAAAAVAAIDVVVAPTVVAVLL
jgi:hypothetical protein